MVNNMKDLNFLKRNLIAYHGIYDNERIFENTLQSYARANKYGYLIQLDIKMMSCGTLICFHDDNLKRMLHVDQNILDISYDELSYISKYQIPTLNEVLDFILKKLEECCGKDKLFINLRSDVFMVVTEYEEEEELIAFINKLDHEISSFKDVKIQLSYGVYTVEDESMELRQMEDRAAMARKAAKNNIVTNIVFYKEQFKESLYNRKFIEESIQTAINERQFMMYLQPKYSISKNEIIGAEALVRWCHPERGMIFPNQFIPIIEENGFIRKVDYYIWEEACRFIRKCVDSGINTCPVSVNVSRIHLQDNECIDVLDNLIKSYHIPKRLLELEITETADDQQISLKALELKDEGFKLLMDDFGSGYSSLNILLETPFDVIKLDKKFIENMMVSDKGKLILEHIVLMAEKLNLGLLAEGVETKEQIEVLQSIGCDQVQGYYYAKPMPKREFFSQLEKQYSEKAIL